MWTLWRPGAILQELPDLAPVLASWNRADHPDQVRLRAYLDGLTGRLAPLPDDRPLWLRLTVDVKERSRLLRFHDMENYLFPLFGRRYLSHSRFVLVTGLKTVGGGSCMEIGVAERGSGIDLLDWTHTEVHPGAGAQDRTWKTRIRDHLAALEAPPLPPGPVRVHLAWRCARRRNWTALWKPTGDAMGPVLGEPRPFNPLDDRIVELNCHLETDDRLGNDVVVGMWWRAGDAAV